MRDGEGFQEWDDSEPMEWDEYAAICEANFRYEQALAGNLPDDSDESMPTWTKKELRDEYRAMIADRKERERNEY